jgi:hypothetical protein
MRRYALAVACLALSATSALAHFRLVAPESLSQQNGTGDPQKNAPCGPVGMGTPTNMVTTVAPGGMLTVTVTETVSHGGHYYVAIAPDRASLPAAPGGTDPVNCNGLAPRMNPQLPILADGLFAQLTPANGPQTVQIQLPAGMECPNCVVQVVEYMTNHAQPCFYYHCATVNVSNGQPMPPDAGVTPGQEAGPGPGPGPSDETTGGCCSAQGGRANSLLLAFAVGLLVLRRRRR